MTQILQVFIARLKFNELFDQFVDQLFISSHHNILNCILGFVKNCAQLKNRSPVRISHYG